MTRTAPVTSSAGAALAALVFAALAATVSPPTASAEQPPAPCHPNPNAAADSAAVAARGDVAKLPQPLKDRLVRLADRPTPSRRSRRSPRRTSPSQLFQYYLLDTTGLRAQRLHRRRSRRQRPGDAHRDRRQLRPADDRRRAPGASSRSRACRPIPNDPRAFIDVFTDISRLFVINNESGWYEGWMIHDLARRARRPRRDATATRSSARSLPADADALAQTMGQRQQRARQRSSRRRRAAALPERERSLPRPRRPTSCRSSSAWARTTPCSRATRTRTGSSTTRPTGSTRSTSCRSPAASRRRRLRRLRTARSARCSRSCPGSGPAGVDEQARSCYGDNPNLPARSRQVRRRRSTRSASSASASSRAASRNEIFLDVYERLASFEPGSPFPQRLFDAYAAEVARVDTNGDGIISAVEGRHRHARRTASPTTRACSSRRPRSTASR